ncbi:hypothetical protein HK405_014025, partial [Cladochytrium tenue]
DDLGVGDGLYESDYLTGGDDLAAAQDGTASAYKQEQQQQPPVAGDEDAVDFDEYDQSPVDTVPTRTEAAASSVDGDRQPRRMASSSSSSSSSAAGSSSSLSAAAAAAAAGLPPPPLPPPPPPQPAASSTSSAASTPGQTHPLPSRAPIKLPPRAQDSRRALNVNNLQWWTTDEELRSIAVEAGVGDQLKDKDIVFLEHKINGKSRGLVYLEFTTPAAARAVKDLMDRLALYLTQPAADLVANYFPSHFHPRDCSEIHGKKPVAALMDAIVDRTVLGRYFNNLAGGTPSAAGVSAGAMEQQQQPLKWGPGDAGGQPLPPGVVSQPPQQLALAQQGQAARSHGLPQRPLPTSAGASGTPVLSAPAGVRMVGGAMPAGGGVGGGGGPIRNNSGAYTQPFHPYQQQQQRQLMQQQQQQQPQMQMQRMGMAAPYGQQLQQQQQMMGPGMGANGQRMMVGSGGGGGGMMQGMGQTPGMMGGVAGGGGIGGSGGSRMLGFQGMDGGGGMQMMGGGVGGVGGGGGGAYYGNSGMQQQQSMMMEAAYDDGTGSVAAAGRYRGGGGQRAMMGGGGGGGVGYRPY